MIPPIIVLGAVVAVAGVLLNKPKDEVKTVKIKKLTKKKKTGTVSKIHANNEKTEPDVTINETDNNSDDGDDTGGIPE